MTTNYRIVDLRSQTIDSEHIVVTGTSPEHAVRKALGVDLVRKGNKNLLSARVYWQIEGQPLNMVRFYARVGSETEAKKGAQR